MKRSSRVRLPAISMLYLTATGVVVAAVGLFFAIAALIRRARLDAVATLAVAPMHELDLPAGELVLHLAGPLGTTRLADLSFRLVDAEGVDVPAAPILLRTRRSSGRWAVLLSVRRFQLPRDGAYRLVVTGIPGDRDVKDCALVLARPQGAGLALGIIGVVAAAVTLVVCSVLSLILWLAPPR